MRNRALPSHWSEALKVDIYNKYATVVDRAMYPAYIPKHCVTDLAKALPHGMSAAVPSIIEPLDCSVHTWRAIVQQAKKKMKFPSDERLDELYLDWTFMADVPPGMTDLLFYMNDDDGSIVDGAFYTLFYKKWGDKYGETELVDYMVRYHMHNKWARGWSKAGVPPNTNTLERMHETLKSQDMYDHAEGMANVLSAAPLIGHRFSRNMDPLEIVPVPDARTWKMGQVLHTKGYCHLGLKATLKNDKVLNLTLTLALTLTLNVTANEPKPDPKLSPNHDRIR